MHARPSQHEGSTADPAAIYVGKVMHARLSPMRHRFAYRVMSILVDLDRLAELDRCTPLFRVNRPGLFALHERDHGPRDGSSLRRHVDRLLDQEGVDIAGGRVWLLAYPRMLGYVFNPLAIYYCHAADGGLAALIYEVRNTFGEIHSYVCPVAPEDAWSAGIRQRRDKMFYVSPFIGMAMCYEFRMTRPGGRVTVRILESDRDGPVLAAAFSGDRRELSTRSLVAALLRLPFMTLKVIVAIHFEALRLWLKGARVHPRRRDAQASGVRPDAGLRQAPGVSPAAGWKPAQPLNEIPSPPLADHLP